MLTFQGACLIFSGLAMFTWCTRRGFAVIAARQRAVLRDSYEGSTNGVSSITNAFQFMRRAVKAKSSPRDENLVLLPLSP